MQRIVNEINLHAEKTYRYTNIMTISHVGNVHLPREILLPSRVRRDRHKYHLRSNPYDMALKKSVKGTKDARRLG